MSSYLFHTAAPFASAAKCTGAPVFSSSAIRTIPSAPESHRNPAFRLAGSHRHRTWYCSVITAGGDLHPALKTVFISLVIITLYSCVFKSFSVNLYKRCLQPIFSRRPPPALRNLSPDQLFQPCSLLLIVSVQKLAGAGKHF